MANLRKRNFLIRSWQAAWAVFLRRLWWPLWGEAASGGEVRAHPHYREQTPLDALMLKKDAARDGFVAERQHDQIAAVLSAWSRELVDSESRVHVWEGAMSAGFVGYSLSSFEAQTARSSGGIHAERIRYADQKPMAKDSFLRELQVALSDYSKIVTAEFQVTGMDAGSAGEIRTPVRYELCGEGRNFYREQRVGDWDLTWKPATQGGWTLAEWTPGAETRSRADSAVFIDISAQAFAQTPSYAAQLLHGVDYWRTVLDGACGIDIYGHHGVSVGDIDGDGFDDLYVCQPGGLPNRLYRNKGDGTFEDITDGSGVGLLENTACALFADFRNVGRQDLIVVRATGPLLFVNEGAGKFRLQPGAFQFANLPQGTFTGAAAADYNRDGWLDIYFCLYVYYQGTGQYNYPTPYFDAENGPRNFLMRNNGDGTFRDVTEEAGLNQNNTRFSFCCGWNDYNGDGWPDLFVANDFGRKNLYRNNGDGTFTDVAAEAGVEDVGAGMGVAWFDYDGDGKEDLYVADMWTAAGERLSHSPEFQKAATAPVRALYQKHAMGNSLFRNAGRFEDKTAAAGIGLGRWAWSSDAWDFDHDGWPDLWITNGMVSGPLREDLNSFFWRQVVANSPSEKRASAGYEQGWNALNELIREDCTWSGYERNVFYANHGDGTFSDVSYVVGMDFLEDGRAFALSDFDHDGRQEVFLKNRNAPQLRLLKNGMAELPASIAFRLRGTKSNRDAIGAVVTIETSLGRQTRTLHAGSGFLSQHSKDVFFGLGKAEGTVSATIRWPSGSVQRVRELPVNHRITIQEGAESVQSEPFRKVVTAPSGEQVQAGEQLPANAQTWLLVPFAAPAQPRIRGRKGLLHCGTPDSKGSVAELAARGLDVVTVNADQDADAVGIVNLVYRSIFDRHRDLGIPTSFLIVDDEIVKVYQGPLDAEGVENDLARIPKTREERLSLALPFRGDSASYEFARNHLSSGSMFFQRGYYEEAATCFARALRDEPSSAEAYYGIGSVYLKQEKKREAEASFLRAVQHQASYPDTRANAWNNLGLLAARDGRVDRATDCFEEALRANPDHFVALENLGNAYRQKQRWADARHALEHALSLQPEDPEANYSMAMVFAQTEETGKAEEYFQRALQSKPDYPDALNNLGILYLRTQRRDAAVARFEECIRVAPAFEQAYLNLSRVYAVEGTPEKAKAVLKALLEKRPDQPQAQKELEQLQ